jgi:hypothetical protein
MAKTEGKAISDVLSWIGWARANTADSYPSRGRSMAKARDSLEQSVK